MGIRVHKFLGYGLTDVEYDADSYKQTDPRLNLSALEDLWEEDSEKKLDEYASFLASQPKSKYGLGPALLDQWWLRDTKKKSARQRRSVEDCFAWGVEYRLGNVFAIQPLACADWTRYDDPIDWIEETYMSKSGREPQRDWVEALPHGIHPFSGSYMDGRDGRKLPPEVMTFIRVMSHAREENLDVVEFADSALTSEMWELLGFGSAAEAVENTVPVVPGEVRLLAEFVGVFEDDDTWKQLRPLLYTYWS